LKRKEVKAINKARPKKIKKLPRITFPLGDKLREDFEKLDFEAGFLTAFLLAIMGLRVWGQKYKFASANIKKRENLFQVILGWLIGDWLIGD